MTAPLPFVPIVHDFGLVLDEALLRDAQALADEALSLDFDEDIDTYPTKVHGLYVCPMPVRRHQDLEGAERGMLVRGLVLRSDGHRLHSQRLNAAGIGEGILLKAGDFYELDPYDFHWTSVPEGPEHPQLLFHVEGDLPDRRTPQYIAEQMILWLRGEMPFVKPQRPNVSRRVA